MKRLLSIVIFHIIVLSCFGQQEKVNIGILTRNVDTSFTHLYVDQVPALNKLNQYPFNLLDYYLDHIAKSLPDSNIIYTPVAWQSMFNKFNFYNINGKPSKKCKEWLNAVSLNDSIDYLIFLDAKDKISSAYYSGIKSNSYGMATFYVNWKMITLYAQVYPRIYKFNPVEEIEINRLHMPYLSNVIILDREDKLALSEVETITDKYYMMALDSIKYYTDGQIKLISKGLLNEINK